MENKEKDEFFDPPAPEEQRTSGGSGGSGYAPSPAGAPSKRGLSRTVRIVALVLGAVVLASGAFVGGWFGRYYALDEEVRTYLWAKSVVEKNYYLPVDEAELYESLYGTLSLDPYTKLYSAEDYDAYMAEGAGENMGIGISFYTGGGKQMPMQIFSVTENSPARELGIQKGMYLLSYGDPAVSDGDYEAFKQFLSGQEGEFVIRCGFEKDGSDAKDYILERKSYQASFMFYRDSESSFGFRGEGKKPALTEIGEPLEGLDEKTAYLRLDEFSGNNSSKEFEQLLLKMKERGRENLILDLRSNGGGYIGILGDISSHFMKNAKDKNPVLMSTTSRSGKVTRYVVVQNDYYNYFTENSHIYVLADEHTASASECLLGVMIDYGAISYSDIYLRKNEAGVAKTYGKGIMQTHIDGPGGANMKLTTATVSWPISGRCIHSVGITESDGAVGISAPLIWGKEDPMLLALLQKACG